jgi:hypothetical protein
MECVGRVNVDVLHWIESTELALLYTHTSRPQGARVTATETHSAGLSPSFQTFIDSDSDVYDSLLG